MGAFSRSKGSREERGLVQYLKDRGYDARRIPLSGAMQGFKHDVEATKDGQKITFEMKSRKNTFKGIYRLYLKYKEKGVGVVRFCVNSSGPFVAFGYDLEEVKRGGDVHFQNLLFYPPPPEDLRVFKKVVNLDKLRAGADFLVCKDNRANRLFFRFWV